MRSSFKNLLKVIPCLYSSNKTCILENKSYKVKLYYVGLFWFIQGIFGFTLYPIFGLFIFGQISETYDSLILLIFITMIVLWLLLYIILIIFAYFSPLIEVKEENK